MEKNILNARDLASIKRIAMNVDADYQKVQKLTAKVDALNKEILELQTSINEMEAPVIRKTNGWKSTDLYEKIVSPMYNEDGSLKLDKNGHVMKTTKYQLRYPDTIIPPVDLNANEGTNVVEENTENSPSWNEGTSEDFQN